jgi:hypothetical protein
MLLRRDNSTEQQQAAQAYLRDRMWAASFPPTTTPAETVPVPVVAQRIVMPTVQEATEDDVEYEALSVAVDRGMERERRSLEGRRKRQRSASTATTTESTELAQPPRQRPRYMHDCFLCAYGSVAFDGSADAGCKPYVALVNMIKQLYGTMSNDELSVMLANYYDQHLYQPALRATDARGEPCPLPEMPPIKFKLHIERAHTLNPTIMVGETTRYVYEAIILNRTEHAHNERAVDKLTKLTTALKSLLSMSRQTYFGSHMHGEQLALDPATVGEPSNLRRVRPLLARDATTLGGATAADNSTVAAAGRPNFNIIPSVHDPDDGELSSGEDDSADVDVDALFEFDARDAST